VKLIRLGWLFTERRKEAALKAALLLLVGLQLSESVVISMAHGDDSFLMVGSVTSFELTILRQRDSAPIM